MVTFIKKTPQTLALTANTDDHLTTDHHKPITVSIKQLFHVGNSKISNFRVQLMS